jgi:hypothetical protein
LKQQIFSTIKQVSESSVKCLEIMKQVRGGEKLIMMYKKSFQMSFKTKGRKFKLNFEIHKGQWKSFQKPVGKDFIYFLEISKLSVSFLQYSNIV